MNISLALSSGYVVSLQAAHTRAKETSKSYYKAHVMQTFLIELEGCGALLSSSTPGAYVWSRCSERHRLCPLGHG